MTAPMHLVTKARDGWRDVTTKLQMPLSPVRLWSLMQER